MSQASPVNSLSPSAERSPFLSHDPEFGAVLGDAPRLAHVVSTDAHEGPVYHPAEHAVYFTSVRRGASVAIKRLALRDLTVTVVREDANVANGMTLDLDGRLLICEQGSRSAPAAIARLDGPVVTDWRGLPLNSPNDVVVKSDGTIWFTDPSYGFLQGFRPEPALGDYVYRHDPATGATAVVADSFDKPNGLCFSPDERVLYVGDSGTPRHVKAFDVLDGRHLANERLFAVIAPGYPDGLKTDSGGRVYSSCEGGVQVFSRSGDLIGEIDLPGAVNFCFGGPERDVLYVTTDDAIWAAHLAATGPTTRAKGA